LAVKFAPVVGEVIAATGTPPLLTVTFWLFAPKALVQVTVMTFVASGRFAVLLALLPDVEGAPATVQVVPAGIVVDPSTV
jgi:hypothetical protein